MKQLTITLGGQDYPCRVTMGAMLRFKRETGREVTHLEADSLSDLCTWLWCCTASAAQADGIPFTHTLMDFADAVSPDDLAAWTAALQDGSAPDEAAPGVEKKNPQA